MRKATPLRSRLSTQPASLKLCKVLTTFDNTLARNGFYSLPLAQGVVTLQLSATMTVIHGFFVPCFQFLLGRGGAYSIQDLFKGRYARRLLLAVTNTPISLVRNHLVKTKGGIHHA